jgi:hypothetical protein
MLPVGIYGPGPSDLVRLFLLLLPSSHSSSLLSRMKNGADGRYEIEIGPGIFNCWID